MALLAEKVLQDCRIAHEIMEVETSHDQLRVEWIGALALIRLVGDVLHKVDAQANSKLGEIIKQQYLLQKDDPIFRHFIKGARDRAIHEYSHDLLDVSEIPVVIENSDGNLENDDLQECHFMPLTGDFRFGEDARDVYLEAINWWKCHIASIEKKAK